jgi:hypothetical protein
MIALPETNTTSAPPRIPSIVPPLKLIALFIIFATAATLNASGVTDIQTSSQAAGALRPIAGVFTFALFAAGIVATGMLAVPYRCSPARRPVQ